MLSDRPAAPRASPHHEGCRGSPDANLPGSRQLQSRAQRLRTHFAVTLKSARSKGRKNARGKWRCTRRAWSIGLLPRMPVTVGGVTTGRSEKDGEKMVRGFGYRFLMLSHHCKPNAAAQISLRASLLLAAQAAGVAGPSQKISSRHCHSGPLLPSANTHQDELEATAYCMGLATRFDGLVECSEKDSQSRLLTWILDLVNN